MRKREKERIWKIRRLKGTPAALIGLVNAPDEAKPNESGEPAAEAGELIRRQLGNSRSDFFDFHVLQYSTPSRACGATDVPRTLTQRPIAADADGLILVPFLGQSAIFGAQ